VQVTIEDLCCTCSDVMCGQLHCTPADKLVSFQPMVYLTIDSHVTVGGRLYECDSAIIDVGTQFTDPGLAPDGAKCADGKVGLPPFTLFLLLPESVRCRKCHLN